MDAQELLKFNKLHYWFNCLSESKNSKLSEKPTVSNENDECMCTFLKITQVKY